MSNDSHEPNHEKEPDHLLREKLERLLRLKRELGEDRSPIPAELDEKIHEVGVVLELE